MACRVIDQSCLYVNLYQTQDAADTDKTGTSLGSVVVFYCLLQLAEEEKPPTDLIYSATLISLPIAPSTEAWQKARSVVAGPLKSAWSGNDWVLALMARMAIHVCVHSIYCTMAYIW